jgi:hypothetical protein
MECSGVRAALYTFVQLRNGRRVNDDPGWERGSEPLATDAPHNHHKLMGWHAEIVRASTPKASGVHSSYPCMELCP